MEGISMKNNEKKTVRTLNALTIQCIQTAVCSDTQQDFRPRKGKQSLQNTPTYLSVQFLIFQIKMACYN